MSRFIHLHVHSHYSLLDGLSKIDDIIAKTKSHGMDAIALTDHGVLYGAIEFYKKARAAGIKPILGVETYVAPFGHEQKRAGVDDKRYHLILLAKDLKGWQNLIKLITVSHLKGFYYKPRVDKDLLRHYHEGLIGLSACMTGEVARLLRDGKKEEAYASAKEYEEIFGKGNYFIELGRHKGIPESEQVTDQLIQLSKTLGIPPVATKDSHYTNKEDAEAHDVLLAVQTGNRLNDEDRLTLRDSDFSLCDAQTMIDLYKDIPEAIENTGRIADMCDVQLQLGKTQLPKFDVPEGETPNSYIRVLARRGLEERYDPITPEVEQRFEYELGVIEKTGFADYFLIVQDFINWAKSQGIVVGPGRGSAAGSIISYCLNITDIDPLKYDLLFERFLNPDRIQMPDIDIDITDLRRDEVLAYIKQKYGEDRVAQIITFGTMAARAAVRDACRALGLPYAVGDQISKLIPFNTKLDQALEQITELATLYKENPDAKRVIDSAKKLEGVVRHASVHACGTVISARPLPEQVPLQRAPQDDTNIITQFEMHSIEDLGLLKMDLLGLRNLTIIEEAIRVIEENAGVRIDFKTVPLDDAKTFKLFQGADTVGVFQLESDGMRHNIKELKPTRIEDILVMVALYRPGPMELIPQYIARKHGKESITYLHPMLEPVMRETYGIGVYQEQMMRIARDLAGFTLAEADTLRKAIGKKIKSLLDEQKGKLISGMIKNGIPAHTANAIWELFPPFAQYGFNKSHAAAYATIGYQTAYLKANYPVEFMTSLFRAEATETERASFLIAEAKKMGIETLSPDINQSADKFAIDKSSDKPAIRFGLGAIKNVGEHIVEAVIAERRRGGPFENLEDFLSRVKHKDLNKKSLESLVKCGALDSFGAERNQLLLNMDELLKFVSAHRNGGGVPQAGLFESMDYKRAALNLKKVAPAGTKERLTWEKELLGFYLSEHPLTQHKAKLEKAGAISIETVNKATDGRYRVAGVVSNIKKIVAKNGKPMLFARIEDASSAAEVVVFNDVYEKNPAMWTEENVVLVNAKPSIRNGKFNLICQSAMLL